MSFFAALTVTIWTVNLFICTWKLANANTDCETAHSCSNMTIIEKEGSVNCYGSWSCWKSNITNIGTSGNINDQETSCAALRACQSATSVAVLNPINNTISNVDMMGVISGYLGVAWASQVIAGDSNSEGARYHYSQLTCSGEAACNGVSFISADNILCNGLRSCSDIDEGYVGKNLGGYGSFALMNSEFYSNVNGRDSIGLSVELYGFFAGFNAVFYCQSGDTCKIQCGTNGCFGFNVYCDATATCSYDCEDVLCPNVWINGSLTDDSDDKLDIFSANEIIQNAFAKEYSRDVSYELNDECDRNCNDYTECFTVADSHTNHNYCCNGRYSCPWGKFAASVCKNIYCNGATSCASKVEVFMNNVGDIYLRGASSGSDAVFKNFDKIQSSGDSALWSSEINHGNTIYCFATKSCAHSKIYHVSTIYALGYDTLFETHIFSNGSNIDIYLLSHHSGYGMELTCQGDDKCTIYGLNASYGEINPDDVNCGSAACPVEFVVIDSSYNLTDSDPDCDADADESVSRLMTKCNIVWGIVVQIIMFYCFL